MPASFDVLSCITLMSELVDNLMLMHISLKEAGDLLCKRGQQQTAAAASGSRRAHWMP